MNDYDTQNPPWLHDLSKGSMSNKTGFENVYRTLSSLEEVQNENKLKKINALEIELMKKNIKHIQLMKVLDVDFLPYNDTRKINRKTSQELIKKVNNLN